MHKDTRALVKAARKQGFAVDETRRHLKFYHPNNPQNVVWVPSTPSDHRSVKNSIALLRAKLGFVWKGR